MTDMLVELANFRIPWEKTMRIVATKWADEATQLVVLKDTSGLYHCHRYMRFAGSWDVSRDVTRCSAEQAISWAFEPKAVPF